MNIRRIKDFLLRHEYLIWILCLCAILRLPSLIEPYWYGDEGIYLTLGNAIRHGLHVYKDIHDNKPPVIYWMAALTGSVFWFRFLLLVWNSVAIILFERLARFLFSETNDDGTRKIIGLDFPIPRWSTLATLLFALVPLFAEGNIANGEIFMIAPVIAGMLLLWQRPTTYNLQPTTCVFAGLLFSLAFLIKVPALFDAAAAGFFFFVVAHDWRKTRISYLVPLFSFSLSFLIPILFTLLYYISIGAGKQYFTIAFAQNIGYLSTWSGGSHQASSVTSSGLKIRAIVLLLGAVLTWIVSKKNGKTLTFLLLWFGFALFGALLSGRPYPHYLIQVVPPAVLIFVFSLKSLISSLFPRTSYLFSLKCLSTVIAFTLLIFAIYSIKFWYYPVLPYYENYVQFVSTHKTKEAYISYFGKDLPALYETAEYVQIHTGPDDRIFVWGDVPMLYALSRRLPAGRFTSAYHIVDFGGQAETIEALGETQPSSVIIDSGYAPPYSELQMILTTDYERRYSIGPYVLYQRL